MKKRNLNFLLALLAALALVFAGACSDGSDDDGGTTTDDTVNPSNEETPEVETYETYLSGTTWKYEIDEDPGNDKSFISAIELEFDDDTSAVAGTVDYTADSSGTDTNYSGTFSGTYSVSDNTVTVYFGSGTSVYITLELDTTSYGDGGNAVTISDATSSESTLEVQTVSASAEYKVSVSLTEGEGAAVQVDLFSTSLDGGNITTSTKFTCTDDGVAEED